MRNKSIFICASILLLGAFILFTRNVLPVSAQTACNAASIAAGTCNWNGGGSTFGPANTPRYPFVFVSLAYISGITDLWSINPNVTTTNGAPDWQYVPPGQWWTMPAYRGTYATFIDYNAGDAFKYPNGTIVTVLAGGTSYNCMVGLMNSNGCPIAILPVGFTLSVSKSGSGTGLVSGGGVINCGSTCSGSVGKNFPNILTATPDANSTFASWSGACSGTSPTCTVTANGNTSVTAIFNSTCVQKNATGGASVVIMMSTQIGLSDNNFNYLSDKLSNNIISNNPGFSYTFYNDLTQHDRNTFTPSQSSCGTDKMQYIFVDPAVITVAGGFTSQSDPIFTWMDSNISRTNTLRIPGGVPSIARGTAILESSINDQTSHGNRVLVVGHSVGSITTYNVKKLYQNQCVSSVYVDPPYNTLFSKIPVINLLPGFSSMHQAATDGIEFDLNSVKWTGGAPFIGLNYLTHNPWSSLTSQNNPTNTANLSKLAQKINNSLITLTNSTCSLASDITVSIVSSPTITSIITPAGPGSTLIKPGDFITLLGGGFSSYGNKIRIEKTSDPLNTYYELYDLPLTANANALSFVMPDLPEIETNVSSGAYSLKVSGLDSDWSSTFSVLVNIDLASSDLVATMASAPDIGKVNLSWADNLDNETGFQIERATDANSSSFTLLTTTAANATSYTDDLTTNVLDFSKEAYRVRGVLAGNTFSDYSNVATVSNCIKLSGNGPRKIVFISDSGYFTSMPAFFKSRNDYIALISSIINDGFKTIDPFMTYFDQFSFYADLHNIDDNSGMALTSSFNNGLSTLNSCYATIGKADIYVYFSPASIVHIFCGAVASTRDRGFVYIDPEYSPVKDIVPLAVIHETGHAFAGLKDEYMISANVKTDYESDMEAPWGGGGENCSTHPSWDYRNSTDNKIYGSVTTRGCRVYTAGSIPRDFTNYFRPSTRSIMRSETSVEGDNVFITMPPNFNVISCGYIIAAINGEALTQKNASKYWKTCTTLNTINKNDIIPLSPTPSITSISAGVVAPGSTLAIFAVSNIVPEKKPFPETGSIVEKISYYLSAFSRWSIAAVAGVPSSITGSGFTPTDNVVQIYNSATTTEILGLTSDGTTLTFTVPANLPSGSYSLKVGAFNSDWSNSVPLTVTIPLTVTNLSCTMSITPVAPCRSNCPITPPANSVVYNNATFKFAGSVIGSITPYTYTLGNVVNASNVAVTSRATVPGTLSARISSKLLPYLQVTSKDGNTAKVQCYPPGFIATTTTNTIIVPPPAPVVTPPTITPVPPSPSTYTITASSNTGGNINPSGNVSVNSNSSQTFIITPNYGYRISSVLVDVNPVGAVTSYTFSNVTANHTITAMFTAIPAQPTIILSPNPTPTPSPSPTPSPTTDPAIQTKRDAVHLLYITLMQREPDQQGLDYWTNSPFPIDQIRTMMMNTAEYRNRINATQNPTPTPTPTPIPTSTPSSTPSPSSSPQVMSNGGNMSISAAIWNAIRQYFESFTKVR